jgi:uroporphyrinogen-III synthase
MPILPQPVFPKAARLSVRSYNGTVPERLPLANKRVLITRTQAGSSELSERLRDAGADVVSVPTIEIVPPDSYEGLDSALNQIEQFQWIVFTSAHAVEVFAARCDLSKAKAKVAVIGPATGRMVEKLGISVALLPPLYVAESLAEVLAPRAIGARVLLIRAADARDVLPIALTQAGAQLTIAEAYRNRIPEDSIPLLRDAFAASERLPDVITFTSASTARHLVDLVKNADVVLPQQTLLASIGPITTRAMEELGLKAAIQAREATIPALVQAISDCFRRFG